MPTNEKMINNVRDIIDEAEQMLSSDNPGSYKEKLQKKLTHAKANLHDFEVEVAQKTKKACKATDEYVQEHPYKAIGATAAVAFLLGLLISRR